jgi:diguanylate cyclase (GGDEF)-like protein
LANDCGCGANRGLLADGRLVGLTVSIGCSTLLPGESVESLLRRADNALYVAKREGRNRLTMAG